MCTHFGVPTSGYYTWKKRKNWSSAKVARDRVLLTAIKKAHKGKRRCYGSPGIYQYLKAQSIVCSRRRVARVMRENGIKASSVGLYRYLPNRHEVYGQVDNVMGHVEMANKPNQQWVADFTYLKTGEGWYYFATVLDRFSRKLGGWSFSQDRNAEFTKASLKMVLRKESPATGLIFHTDQGIEYVADKFQTELKESGLRPSMSRKGRCLDNAMAESFCGSLKAELVHSKRYKTRAAAKNDILSYINFYNNERLHSSLGYLSPVEFLQLRS